MTAMEMNTELFLRLSQIAGNTSYMEQTLHFLRELTEKDTLPTRGHKYQEMLLRLSDFQTYEQGWDDADALPLSNKVVKNFKQVLGQTTDSLLEGWTLYPMANGTLLLMFKPHKAGINIGTTEFSYYNFKNGQLKGSNKMKFSTKAVLQTMKEICHD